MYAYMQAVGMPTTMAYCTEQTLNNHASLTEDDKWAVCSLGIFRVSLAHSPKSINLQRWQQKGLNVFSGHQVFCLPHVGQTIFF